MGPSPTVSYGVLVGFPCLLLILWGFLEGFDSVHNVCNGGMDEWISP